MHNEKKYIVDIPEVIREWDWIENTKKNIFPDKVTHGSTKKAHWICSKGHRYIARIDHRCIMKSGCPYCNGKRPIVGENDLASTHKYLLNEWDYEKNIGINPEDVLAGSNKKVYWKCKKCGHQWNAKIASRALKGNGCPVCASKYRAKNKIDTIIKKKGSLLETHPNLATEWDYTKNEGLTPDKVTAGSNKKVYWIGQKCKHSWQSTIANRVSGNGCPICAGKKVLIGYNDLKTTHPDIAEQWHPFLNKQLEANDIMAGSDRKVWWICPTCKHEYEASVYSRTKMNTNCPLCAGKVVRKGINDLKTTHPEIAEQWNLTKNGECTPNNVTSGSSKLVWWMCKKGHEWQATVNSRVRGNGCPYCAVELSTSYPEQIVYYYLSKVTRAINRYKIKGKELDIYMPDLNIGIEYNGHYYHSNREKQDEDKKCFFQKSGIHVIVIKESEMDLVDGETIYYKIRNKSYLSLEWVIRYIVEFLKLQMPDINIERDRVHILEQYILNIKENSIAERYPWTISEWDYERNGKLTPYHITYGSSKKIYWKCVKCGHKWEAVASSRKTSGCPCCANKIVVAGKNDLATSHPKLAMEWDYEKNEKKPTQVTYGSSYYAWWKCKEGHSWRAQVKKRSKGNGCPICNSKKHNL